MKIIMSLISGFLVLSTLAACSSKKSLDIGGLYPIISADRKWGYIDKSGNVVIQPQFADARFFFDGLACVSPDGKKFGYIDKSGKFAINPQYDAAQSFSEGLACVFIGNKAGYIDTTGTIVINPQFEPVGRDMTWSYSFSEGLASVRTGDKCGYIDKSGKFVVNPQFKACQPFFEGLAAVRTEDKWGYVDATGRMTINPQFEAAFPFTEGLGLVKIGSKYGYIDKSGKFVINPQFDTATPFSEEGIAGARVGDKWGGIDKTGRMVISPQFDGNYLTSFDSQFVGEILIRDIGRVTFSEGLASVCSGKKCGYVDKSGTHAINPQFDQAFPFVNGLALVVDSSGPGAQLGWIDKSGKYVWKRTDNSKASGSPSGVEVTTASGLRYVDLVEGTGATPQRDQTVTVHYVGTLENGRQFDSSRDRGTPADFRIGVGAVIKGWDEALMSMKVGGRRKLIIPPNLGYGSAGRPPDIPPNSILIFDVELFDAK